MPSGRPAHWRLSCCLSCTNTQRVAWVTPAALVLHLGQVLRVHVHIAWLAALEGLVGHHRLLGLEGGEVARVMAAQAPIRARARNIGTDEFPCHGQQVIQRPHQGTPQVNHHSFSCWREHRLQVIGSRVSCPQR